MAWTTIPNANLEPDAPARSIDALALRDNPIAIAAGDSGAPKVVHAGLSVSDVAVGSVQSWATDSTEDTTTATTYPSTDEWDDRDQSIGVRAWAAGVVRCQAEHRSPTGNTVRLRILKNGAQQIEWNTNSVTDVTRQHDLAVAAGDIVVFQQKADSGTAGWHSLQLLADEVVTCNSSQGV